MKGLVTIALATSLLWLAPLSGWAQEENESSCVDACFESEEACYEACSSQEDPEACDSECRVKADRCIEECEK